ncbi:MAG: L-glyceraldehyde 3-phosphate reductase, partial [uncultured Corynebacteriales bacterium]
DLCGRGQPLRPDAVPPDRAQRAAAAGAVPGAVAQLRPRPAVRDAAGDRAAGVRPRGHPLRPGQQLRPAVRVGRVELRPDAGRRPAAVPGRAGDLDQGRLRHVARAVRRPRVAEVPAGVAGPVAGPDGPGLRGHLLQPPARPGHPARGDDGRAGHRGPLRPGAVRRHLLVLGRADPAGGRDPAGAGHAAADPPAVVLDAQPLDRGRRPARHAGRRGRRLHRVLAAGPGAAHRPLPQRRAGRLPGRHRRRDGPRHAHRGPAGPGPRARRAGRPARPVAGPAGAGLGAAGRADDLPGHRGEQHPAAGGQPRRAGRPRAVRGRAGRDRPVRAGLRHRPLGGLQHRV